MSEQEGVAAGSAPDHAGALLRQARERAGLHVATLAATLKVPVKRLEALEQGRYDALPDATYVRALALSVCRVLKQDPAPVLAALPSGKAPELTPPTGSIGTALPREPAAPGFGGGESSGRRTPLWIALVLIVLAGVLWYALPATEPEPGIVAPPVADTPPTPPSAEPAPAVAPQEPPAPAEPAPVPATVPTVPAAESSTAAAPSAETAARPDAALRLQVQATTWVQVVGASGRVWLQRSLQPGELVTFEEDLPLAVTVGRADATAVTVRGQTLDLAPLARNNVARFEVR